MADPDGRIHGPKRKSAKEIMLELLDADESGVDAIVTKRHAEDLAEGLADAMERLGYEIRKKSAIRVSIDPGQPAPITVLHLRCPNCGVIS